MGKWEGLGLNKAMTLKMLMIFVIAFLIISFIIRFQVKSNKIRPGKISRLFYMDDEEYVKYWRKKRNKGKLKFVLYCDVIISITIWTTSMIIIVATDGDFSKLKDTLPAFYGSLIGGTIGYPLGWNRNEKKYNELTKNIE